MGRDGGAAGRRGWAALTAPSSGLRVGGRNRFPSERVFPPPPGSGLRRSRPAVIEPLGEEGGTEGGRDRGGSFCALCVQVARPRGGHGGAGPAPVLLRDRDQQGAR